MGAYNKLKAASKAQIIARGRRILKDIWIVEAARKCVNEK